MKSLSRVTGSSLVATSSNDPVPGASLDRGCHLTVQQHLIGKSSRALVASERM